VNWPWRKRREPALEPQARHIEIWGHFVATHRYFKRLATACVVFAFAGLAFGAYGGLVAINRPLVFAVDGDGRATPQGRRGRAHEPLDVEVRYVAKRFLRATMAFHSQTIESDLADGWNLMTASLQAQTRQEFAAYEAESGQSFADYVRKQQIRTVLDFARIDVTRHRGEVWTVRVRGVAQTWPLNRVGEDAGSRAREFEAQLSIVRVPRTEQTPNGLLVSAQASKFYDIPTTADRAEQRVAPAGAKR
jgi:hypothetical protein